MPTRKTELMQQKKSLEDDFVARRCSFDYANDAVQQHDTGKQAKPLAHRTPAGFAV
jgi:hypothetical protein